MEILRYEFFKRLLGAVNSVCYPCDDPHKNASRYRRSKGQSESIVRLMELEKKVKYLEGIAHEPRTFVSCEECKQKIKEIE